MALETATYLDSLVTSNPAGSDNAATADDHIRLLKACLQRTFPNINAEMSATPAQLHAAALGETTASYAQSADFAMSAAYAGSAGYAQSAGFAGSAFEATVATQAVGATSAQFATSATRATSASFAASANFAASAARAVELTRLVLKSVKSDYSMSSSTTLTDDSAMQGFVLSAGEDYKVEAMFHFDDNGGGIKMYFAASGSVNGIMRYKARDFSDNVLEDVVSSDGVTLDLSSVSATGVVVLIDCIAQAVSSSNYGLQWAQQNSNAAPTVMKLGSHMKVEKVS